MSASLILVEQISMMFIKSFLIVLLLIPVIFVLWMNLTPGYYHGNGCSSRVVYAPDGYLYSGRNGFDTTHVCINRGLLERFADELKLKLALLDFNRGDMARPSTPDYVCPKTEWVNCMPILTPEAQKSCTQEYLDWAKNNCPNFQGPAY